MMDVGVRGARVGPTALDDAIVAPAVGLLPSLAAMMRVEHPSAEPHPDVAAFYEATSTRSLVCVPSWRPMFALPGKLFVRLARTMGQLVLPTDARPHVIVSRLGRLRDHPPRIEPPVASIRTYEDGSPMYVAIYGEHEADGVRYMNIAMPLPLGLTLASILRASPLDDGGIDLSSRPRTPRGHEGLWLTRGPLRVALPLDETLVAHAASTPSGRALGVACAGERATMVARHRFTLFGLPCLELAYAIEPIER